MRFFAAAVLGLLLGAVAWGAPATQPSTRPAEKAMAPLTPEVEAVLKPMAEAYAGLKSAELAGTIEFSFDEGGMPREKKATFTSLYGGPGLFWHEASDQPRLGSTGAKVYGYLARTNVYSLADAPQGKPMLSDLPEDHARILPMQNLSLTLAVAKDPMAELRMLATSIAKGPDQPVDGKNYQALRLTLAASEVPETVLVDPQTHLIRRVVADLMPEVKRHSREDITRATYTVDYTTVKSDVAAKPEQFAWAPPAGAKDLAAMREEGGEENPGNALVGKPAPDFTLEDLDGKKVKLSELKGSVVVLDFWATWCGPCVASMPSLQELHKSQSANGLKLYCVNQQEGKDQVKDFLKEQKLDLPILFDKGEVAKAYMVTGLPTKYVIGRDGIIKHVEVGFGPGSAEELAKWVDEEIKSKGEKR